MEGRNVDIQSDKSSQVKTPFVYILALFLLFQSSFCDNRKMRHFDCRDHHSVSLFHL